VHGVITVFVVHAVVRARRRHSVCRRHDCLCTALSSARLPVEGIVVCGVARHRAAFVVPTDGLKQRRRLGCLCTASSSCSSFARLPVHEIVVVFVICSVAFVVHAVACGGHCRLRRCTASRRVRRAHRWPNTAPSSVRLPVHGVIVSSSVALTSSSARLPVQIITTQYREFFQGKFKVIKTKWLGHATKESYLFVQGQVDHNWWCRRFCRLPRTRMSLEDSCRHYQATQTFSQNSLKLEVSHAAFVQSQDDVGSGGAIDPPPPRNAFQQLVDVCLIKDEYQVPSQTLTYRLIGPRPQAALVLCPLHKTISVSLLVSERKLAFNVVFKYGQISTFAHAIEWN
jgi:hypothetical protein